MECQILFSREKKQISKCRLLKLLPSRQSVMNCWILQNQFTIKIQIRLGSFASLSGSLFVCVVVLQPSQPIGVMSSAVSLPNHTFTGQA